MAACGFRGEVTQITAYERGRGDNLHANCMQIARKNYDLTLIGWGYGVTEPQIKAHRVAPLDGAAHRKVRKERKAGGRG